MVTEIEGRHEIYNRSNFHTTEHPTSNNNGTNYNGNGCNGNAPVNGSRYNQHVSPITRSTNSQADHHRHQPHPG